MNNIEFESCGAHLRNLLTPVQLVADLIKNFQTSPEETVKLFETLSNKGFDLQEHIDRLTEFADTKVMMETNWRQYNYDND